MKRRKRITYLFSLWALLAVVMATTAHAENVVRNGGDAVSDGNALRLRDSMPIGSCEWLSVEDVRERYPEFQRLLTNLPSGSADGESYSVSDFVLQASDEMAFCLSSSPLVNVSTSDMDSPLIDVMTVDPVGKVQVAVKIGNDVFINNKSLNALQPRDQALLFMHEIAHSWVTKESTQRNMRVRSLVKAIDACTETKNACTPADLWFQMVTNSATAIERFYPTVCGIAVGKSGESAIKDCDKLHYRGHHAIVSDVSYRDCYKVESGYKRYNLRCTKYTTYGAYTYKGSVKSRIGGKIMPEYSDVYQSTIGEPQPDVYRGTFEEL